MRRKLFTLLAIALCISLTACGKKVEDNNVTGNDGDITENALESPTPEEVANEDSSVERYEKLLNNQLPLYMNLYNPMRIEWVENENENFEEDKGYSFNEFLYTYFLDEARYSGGDFDPKEVSYAYIDCGNDGIKELALKIILDIQDDTYNSLMVIKDIDNKMQLCAFSSNGCRGYGLINPYGMLRTGGSGGAAYYYDMLDMIDADGVRKMVYEKETIFSPYAMFFPDDGTDYFSILEDMNIEECVIVERCSFEPLPDDMPYDEYLAEQKYTFTRQDSFSGQEMDDPSIYEPTSKYVKFFELVGYDWCKPEEMQDLLDQRYKDMGITEEMLTEDEAEWVAWPDHDGIMSQTYCETPHIVIDNPSYDYYLSPDPHVILSDGALLSLDVNSANPNEIIDTEKWFSSLNLPEEMNRNVIFDEDYIYYLSSSYDDYEKDIIDIVDRYSGNIIATLNFQNYIKPDNVAEGDLFGSFTDESVHFAAAKDGILYVSIYHNTYASAASHNAYIVALDMNNDYKVMWKTEPLTCNSDNFLIMDDFIVCGYGFTDEPDYVYVLNRHNGERMSTTKVKTAPDYFHYADDGKLYVRTYDTDYVFNVSWG